MSSFFSQEEFVPGIDVQLNRFNPDELFPYTVYNKAKTRFNVPPLRKRYALLTNKQIVDMTAYSLKGSLARISDVHAMKDLLKVKYKKGEVISLTFKGDIIVQFGMKDTDRCLQFLKRKMGENGVKANLLTKQYKKNIATAQGLLDAIRDIESNFDISPCYELVISVMDLLRDAVELFGEANDSRYLCSLEHIQNFLQRPDVTKILDEIAQNKKKAADASASYIEDKDTLGSDFTPQHLAERLTKKLIDDVEFNPESEPLSTSVSPLEGNESNENNIKTSGDETINIDVAYISSDSRNLSIESSGDVTLAIRPRVSSRARRRSIRTQSLENAQFQTMDNLHFEDAEDTLWLDDDELLDAEYDMVDDSPGGDDKNIELLDSLIGNMTLELESIVGEPIDLGELTVSPVDAKPLGDSVEIISATLPRGLSSCDIEGEHWSPS